MIVRKIVFRKSLQVSESIEIGALLAFSGGLMDVYSYLLRDHVFANAQTGNIILCAIHLSEGQLYQALEYLAPISGFAIGVAAAQFVRLYFAKCWHWRQTAVLLEAVILFGVSFIPLELNLLANSLTSLACGIQVEAFRKIFGHALATTMCVGNLKSTVHFLCEAVKFRSKKSLRSSLLLVFIILCFVSGALSGKFFISLWQLGAIRVSSIILLVAFCIMFIDLEKHHAVQKQLIKHYNKVQSERDVVNP